ncbi:MAG: energy-coupling factor ABC transporter ATP-binding protein [Kiritimatiellaeota bacterium]|nr:energy-coupling factor ABC transporter ATP-binding protein [Kiritimatiellota bacterium]
MSDALALRDVSVRYHADTPDVLRNVTFTLRPGERCALLGLNGSGKTTLLSAIAGLLPFSGEIAVCGTTLTRATERAVRDNLGFLLTSADDQLLFPQVLDDVAFTLERRGIPCDEARRRAAATLEELGIGALAPCSHCRLSHGQRQRVALAGMLVATPPLLLMDEPTALLDPVGRDGLARMLARQQAAMLIATHDADFARNVAQRFLVLEAGQITCDTTDPSCVAATFTRWREARQASLTDSHLASGTVPEATHKPKEKGTKP